MSKADKKQRHAAKRKAKKLAARRRDSVSPVKRLAEAPGELDCWMTSDFDEFHQAQVYAYKRAGGLAGVACFLIDKGVVGLKDAFTLMSVTREQFDRMLQAAEDQGLRMKRAELQNAKNMIAGAVRWAHDNGMRLPADWVKCASILGGVGDWASADVSKFLKEFHGHPADLQQRLIGEPFDTYIQRTDVEFIFSSVAPYMDQETGEYLNSPLDLDLEDDDDYEDDDDA